MDGNNNVVSRFVYGNDDNVPEYMVKNGVTYRLIKEHLGSVRLVVDSTTGAVAQRVDYDEFGVVLVDTSPGFQPFGFAGGLYDSQTGLVRFGARNYDAQTGRWTAKDPILFDGGDTNLYGYVMNDPVNFADRTGNYSFNEPDDNIFNPQLEPPPDPPQVCPTGRGGPPRRNPPRRQSPRRNPPRRQSPRRNPPRRPSPRRKPQRGSNGNAPVTSSGVVVFSGPFAFNGAVPLTITFR